MPTDSPTHPFRWPLDVRLFAVLSALWSLSFIARISLHQGADLQAVMGGLKFYGAPAAAVMAMQAVIIWVFAVGIFSGRRWALLLALAYMTEVVLSHLFFIVGYFGDPTQLAHIQRAALEGPAAVMITLYVWIRANDLLFDEAAATTSEARVDSKLAARL
jgi:hypothetical protein